jgi:alginate O-acetyltransferase complex protein AlgI
MLFVEPRFLLFFAAVALLYWSLPRNGWRKALLLVASYAFYGAWDWRFLALIGLTTIVDWSIARQLGETGDEHRRKHLVLASLSVNLGVLFAFKYLNFFADSAAALLESLGIPVNWTTLNIVLPVGISFYTFQSLSYTIDVYRREVEPRWSLADFALFVAFFPQLVAGPIVRAADFLPQLDGVRRFAEVPVRACLVLFLIGYFKKACVSDNIAPLIDPVFAKSVAYGSEALVAAVLLYAVQIYCDFSGYSDMAIALAGLLGYRLPLNFAWPYFADGIIDFWRRWHMSLSTWLRDLSLHPARRQPPWRLDALPQSAAHHGAGRALAWGLLELRHLGRSARAAACSGAWLAGFRARPCRTARHLGAIRPRWSDRAHLLLRLARLDLFPGTRPRDRLAHGPGLARPPGAGRRRPPS